MRSGHFAVFLSSPGEIAKELRAEMIKYLSAAERQVTIYSPSRASRAEESFHEVVVASHRAGDSVLAILNPSLFNRPQLQYFVQQQGRGTRLGIVVADEPQNITWAEVEPAFHDWLEVWEQTEKEPASARKDSRTEALVPTRAAHPPYLELTERLRDTRTGRLDAGKIARLLGLTTTEMGLVCGVSKQAISKNPVSKGIQEALQVLQGVALGVLWFGGDEARFRAWLNQPNQDFPIYRKKQPSPLDMIRMGHAQVVADKVQNLLTGHPS